MKTPADWVCPSCGQQEGDAALYCSACGEARIGPGAQGPGRLPDWQQSLRRWGRTLKLLVTLPGALTVHYRDGARQRLVRPVALFLGINVVFFIAQSLSGFSVFAIPLQAHVQSQPYSDIAADLVNQRVEAKAIERHRYFDRFNAQQQTLAKASVIVLVPPLAAVLALVFRRWRAGWSVHGAHALQVMAFLLLFLCAFFPLLAALMRVGEAVAGRIGPGPLADLATLAEAAVVLGYAYASCRRVYAAGAGRCALAALLILVALALSLYGHRYAVFWLTAWTV